VTDSTWRPNVVVAAIVERDGRFLVVEEETADGLRINQPAGHWEHGETLVQAVVREALEETAYQIEPRHLLGIYSWQHELREITYLRFAFVAQVVGHEPTRPLDTGVLRALWLSPEELAREQARHRSPLVHRCVADYLAGRRFPLDLLLQLD
jgi:8-oxo-dGTP pyrophosphatase MutT (NUDIX family)